MSQGFNVEDARIAYFSMEIGINSNIPTYSGGLGVLAGDFIMTASDMRVPMVGMTLLYKSGYFFQKLDEQGNQHEYPVRWEPSEFMQPLDEHVTVSIEKRRVVVRAWQYIVRGGDGFQVPVLFLDTDLPENSEYDRGLTGHLYGGDMRYRIAQEIVLGIGGVRMLKKLGYSYINRYHMNEGHAAFLTLELLKERHELDEHEWDVDSVKRHCVFTTHTPVPAGHDKFPYDLVRGMLDDFVGMDILKALGGETELNMTLLALNLSHYVNGVAEEHGKVTRQMFPGYVIDSITNGVYSQRWICDCFKVLYDKYIPEWGTNPFSFRYALSIPSDEIWDVHQEAKRQLIEFVNETTGAGLDFESLTIGFGRRATAYKRADLIFHDIRRLVNISQHVGKLQFVFAGKAHPADQPGKDVIRKIAGIGRELKGQVAIAYLENYATQTARMMVSGSDVWLNTPRRPKEASGTSGMKAAHNCVPSLSVLDGWWIEGCLENVTGWAIGSPYDTGSSDERDALALYDALEHTIIPMFYRDRRRWIEIMRHSLALNASFFNTHRMMTEYIFKAYNK